MKKLTILLIGLSLTFSVYSQSNKQIDWNTDLNYIADSLPKKHFNLFSVKNQEEYLTGIENIRKTISSKSDFEIAISLQQLIAECGDSHTNINWRQLVDKKQILPLGLYWFKNGIHILKTSKENKAILGHQLLAINNVKIERIVDSLSSLITVDNQACVKKTVPNFIPLVQLLRKFGIVKSDKIELKLLGENGKISSWNIKPVLPNRNNSIAFKPDSISLCFRDTKTYFLDYNQKDDDIYYVQYNKCSSREWEKMRGRKDADTKPSINEFAVKVLKTLDTKSVNKFVFDMRFNGGGSSHPGTKLIEKIALIQKQRPELKIYVVVGRKTFSSAIINAMDFKRLSNAIYLGEETSGKPNHFGELWDFTLPSSGIKVLYSTKYFKETDDHVNSIMPDELLEVSFEDFKNGIDPVYEWIKKQ